METFAVYPWVYNSTRGLWFMSHEQSRHRRAKHTRSQLESHTASKCKLLEEYGGRETGCWLMRLLSTQSKRVNTLIGLRNPMYNPTIPPYGERMGSHLRHVVFLERRSDRRSLLDCCCYEVVVGMGFSNVFSWERIGRRRVRFLKMVLPESISTS